MLQCLWLCLIIHRWAYPVASVIRSFDPNAVNRTVALTFDDGPHGTLTPRLLDILKAKGVRVTFFVMGIKAVMHPEIVKRAHDEGHEIANHAWDHPVLTKITRNKVLDQLQRTSSAIEGIIHQKPVIMRPPYGNTNGRLNSFIFDHEKLSVVLWSFDTQDWKRPPSSVIVKNAISSIRPGGVVLCHDIHPGTVAAIPPLIDGLRAEGYSFATVSELIKAQESQYQQNQSSKQKRHLRDRPCC